jgi:pheromone shutdown protein TraB
MDMKGEIYNVDYNEYVSLLGTAHFTKRSLHDAYEAVRRLQPSDLAIELDLNRFKVLNNSCSICPKRSACDAKCEFIGATEALGNVDANIWLIDMSEHEIGQRIRRLTTPTWIYLVRIPFVHEDDEITRWWERGFKDEVLNSYRERLENLRRHAPAIWRVLIDERDTLMAVRLAWIATEKLREKGESSILALVGAAHVEGIKDLLRNPAVIRENLKRLGLSFTPPTLIRRISVRGDQQTT